MGSPHQAPTAALVRRKKLAVVITMNSEYWDLTKESGEPCYAGGPPMLPDSLPGNVADYPNFTWREHRASFGPDVVLTRFFAAPASSTETGRPKVPVHHRSTRSRLGQW